MNEYSRQNETCSNDRLFVAKSSAFVMYCQHTMRFPQIALRIQPEEKTEEIISSKSTYCILEKFKLFVSRIQYRYSGNFALPLLNDLVAAKKTFAQLEKSTRMKKGK